MYRSLKEIKGEGLPAEKYRNPKPHTLPKRNIPEEKSSNPSEILFPLNGVNKRIDNSETESHDKSYL